MKQIHLRGTPHNGIRIILGQKFQKRRFYKNKHKIAQNHKMKESISTPDKSPHLLKGHKRDFIVSSKWSFKRGCSLYRHVHTTDFRTRL